MAALVVFFVVMLACVLFIAGLGFGAKALRYTILVICALPFLALAYLIIGGMAQVQEHEDRVRAAQANPLVCVPASDTYLQGWCALQPSNPNQPALLPGTTDQLLPGTTDQPEDLGYGTGQPTEPPAHERASDPQADTKALDTLIRNENLTPLN